LKKPIDIEKRLFNYEGIIWFKGLVWGDGASTKSWKWFFLNASHYVKNNRITELDDIDILKEIIGILQDVVEKNELLPDKFQNRAYIKKITDLSDESAVILLEFKRNSFSKKASKNYRDLGRVLHDLSKVLVTVAVLSTPSVPTNNLYPNDKELIVWQKKPEKSKFSSRTTSNITEKTTKISSKS